MNMIFTGIFNPLVLPDDPSICPLFLHRDKTPKYISVSLLAFQYILRNITCMFTMINLPTKFVSKLTSSLWALFLNYTLNYYPTESSFKLLMLLMLLMIFCDHSDHQRCDYLFLDSMMTTMVTL